MRLETMHYCETCGAIVVGSEPHSCVPALLARIAELERESADWRQQAIEANMEVGMLKLELVEADDEVKTLKRALLLACSRIKKPPTIYDEWRMTVDQIANRYIERAQKESRIGSDSI